MKQCWAEAAKTVPGCQQHPGWAGAALLEAAFPLFLLGFIQPRGEGAEGLACGGLQLLIGSRGAVLSPALCG